MNEEEVSGVERKLARLSQYELEAYRREQFGDQRLDMDEDWDCEWDEEEEEDIR